MCSKSPCFPPISFYILATTLSHLIPACLFYFLRYSPISYGWQPLFWHVSYFTLSFQLSHVSYLFYVGTFPFLLLLLYYSSYLRILLTAPFLATVSCISSCFTYFAFPSHVSAYSGFGTITLLIIHILVSNCESVRIASILRTCALHFPIIFFLRVYPKNIILRFQRQRMYNCLRSVIHLLPTSIWKLPGSPYLRYIQLLHTFLRSLSLSIY